MITTGACGDVLDNHGRTQPNWLRSVNYAKYRHINITTMEIIPRENNLL